MQPLAIPRSAIAAVAVLYALTFVAWLFLAGGLGSPHWATFTLAAVVAATFVSFGVSLSACLKLFGAQHPTWLSRGHAAGLAAGGFLLQSLLAGALALVGAWPHKDLWFLGVIPYFWRG